MEKRKNIPLLRFPEFEGEWEKKKLGDIISRVTIGVEVKPTELYQQIGIRSHGKGIFYKEAVRGKELGNKRVFWIVDNALIVNIVFAWEHAISKTTSNEIGMIASHRFPMYLPRDSKSNINYLIHFFLTPKGKTLLELASPGGAGRNKTLGQSEFLKLSFNIPSISEQIRIASFFSILDQKITQLKQKKILLEQYKKGLIHKIFSQQVRFKNDTGQEYPTWEKVKLGDLGFFQTSSIDKLSVEGEKQVFLVNYLNVYRHESINKETKNNLQIVTAKDSQIISNSLQKGDILFTPSSETPDDIGHSVVIFENLDKCVYSYHLIRFRPTVTLDILFSHYFCNVPYVLNQLTKLATGSTRFTISIKSFSSILIMLPSVEEQSKIAKLLSAIDDKISHTQIQIEKAVLWKNGLLQKMFV